MDYRESRLADVDTVIANFTKPPPPPPLRNRERSDSLRRHEDQFSNSGLQVPITRTKHGDTEEVYFSSLYGDIGPGMKKSSDALRMPEYVYVYMLACVPSSVRHIVGSGVLTCKPSSSKAGFLRTDVYNTSQEKADTSLRQLNSFSGSLVDKLSTVDVDAYVIDYYMDIVHELTDHFTCAIMKKDHRVKIICKSELTDDISRWLENQTGGADRDVRRSGDGSACSIGNILRSRPPRAARGSGFRVHGKCEVYAQVNDITKLRVDVIVEPANPELCNDEGLSDTIARLGGPVYIVACHNYVQKHGKLPPTKVVPTLPGNLKCQRVLHAVLPWPPGRLTSDKVMAKFKKQIAKMFKNILKKIDKKDTRDAALPLMAQGSNIAQ